MPSWKAPLPVLIALLALCVPARAEDDAGANPLLQLAGEAAISSDQGTKAVGENMVRLLGGGYSKGGVQGPPTADQIRAIGDYLDKVPPPYSRDLENLMTNVAGAFNRLAGAMAKGDASASAPIYKQGLDLDSRILAQNASNVQALDGRAAANLGLQQYPQAVQDASAAVQLNNNDENAYTTRALAQYQLGNYPQAHEDANRALALDPNNEVAFQVMKLTEGRVKTAERLALNPAQKLAAKLVAQEYESMERQRSELEASSRSGGARRSPAAQPQPGGTVPALLQRATEKIKDNDPQGAIALAAQALALQPGNLAALYQRAVAEAMVGRYADAVRDAGEILSRDPRDLRALDARSSAYLHLNRYQEAKLDAEAALALDPSDAYAYRNRSLAEGKLGDTASMCADLSKAAHLNAQFFGELQASAQCGRQLTADLNVPRPDFSAPRREAPAPARWPLRAAVSLLGALLIAFGLRSIWLRRSGRSVTFSAVRSKLDAGYKVLGTLGAGGMGVVLEAQDKALARKVAIKKMRDEIRLDERQRERFLQEARIVAALHHPNIVDIHSILEDGGELYLIFEFVHGDTLEKILRQRQRLSLEEGRYVVHGVTAALDYAHARGVVHRDLKPSNIMWSKDGAIKVMDFGVARQAKDALARSTNTNTVGGTPVYMAPEQEHGVLRRESDIFSLGACLYEMLTGVRPFAEEGGVSLKSTRSYEKPTRWVPQLPPEINAFMDAALEPDPEKRIHTAKEFRVRFDSILKSPEIEAG